MKKILLFITLLIGSISFAQAPQGINYQAVAYDANGFELSSQNIGVRISIIEGDVFGASNLVEVHSLVTSNQGLFSLQIGQGEKVGGSAETLSDIAWGTNTYFLKIELDVENNGSYMDFGTQQFMSVPYALYAESSGAVGPEGPEGPEGPQGEVGPQGEPADPVDYDSLSNMISVDSTFLASVTGGIGGCDFIFPEGIDGDYLVHDLSTSYTVPEGKNLYITHVYADGGDLLINGVRQLYGYFNYSQAGTNYVNSFNIIVGEGQVVTMSSSNVVSFTGFVIDKTVIEPISHSLSGNANGITSSIYNVPLNKKLIINNIFIYDNNGGLLIDDILVQYGAKNMSWGGSDIDFSNTLLVDGGSTVTGGTMETSINGYLVDEDYFANCGSSSSSASNATIDSLSQVVSNLDSSLTALTSQINFGCTDPSSCNYDSTVNLNDGSCTGILGCADSTATNYNPSATCDDGSCTPLAIGDIYQGGIVFYLDGNGGGLTTAIADQSTGADWGCYGTTITGADGTAIGTGNQNTIDIETECITSGIAADLCANLILSGYGDWFLPSRDELELMYINLHNQGLGSFSNDYYWSSSEWGPNDSWYVYFADGTVSYLHPPIYKQSDISVRAIRAF